MLSVLEERDGNGRRATGSPKRDDALLVEDLLAGDEEAFTALVRREYAAMVRYAQLFVSSRASAEEVVQEAWMGILAGLPRFEGRCSFRRWMYDRGPKLDEGAPPVIAENAGSAETLEAIL